MTSPDAIATLLPELLKKKRFWKRAIWWASASVILPPMGGFLVTVIKMTQAFEELGDPADADALGMHIGNVLQATAMGLTLSFFGLIFLVIAIIRFSSYRKQCRSITGA